MKWLRRTAPSRLFTVGKVYPAVYADGLYLLTTDSGLPHKLVALKYNVGWDAVSEESGDEEYNEVVQEGG